MAPRTHVRLLALPSIFAALALGGCNEETSSGSGTTTTTSSSTGSSSGGGGTSTGGQSTGGSGGSGGSTTTSGGSGGATTTSSTSDTGGAGPACSAFARRYGSADPTLATTVAGAVADAFGGVILGGDFAGSIQVGVTTLTSVAGQDGFLAGLKPGGGVAWRERFGAAYDDKAKAIAATPDGGAVIVGTFDGVVDFLGEALTSISGPDAFVLRVDATGALVFVLQLENADARSVAIAEDGDILVAGDFMGATTIAGLPLTAGGAIDLFVARLAGDGSLVAARQAAFEVKPGAIAIGAGAGHAYVTGSFQGTVDLGAGPLVSAGAKDVFLAGFDSALTPTFSRRFGDDSSQEARAVAVLSDGSVAITGGFKSVLDIDGAVLTADTQDDVFVARFDAAGTVLMAENFGDAGAQIGRAIAVDANDDLYIAGGFTGSILAGGDVLTSAAGEDVFLMQLSPMGIAVKGERWGGAGDQRARSVSIDPCGAVVLAGDMGGTITFGADALDATGVQDGFVARLAP